MGINSVSQVQLVSLGGGLKLINVSLNLAWKGLAILGPLNDGSGLGGLLSQERRRVPQLNRRRGSPGGGVAFLI